MKLDDYEIIVLKEEELDEALVFQKRIISGMKNKAWFTPLTREEFLKPMQESDNVYMLKDGESKVGLFVATIELGEELNKYGISDDSVLLIDSIMVDEKYRGKGLQRRILGFLFKRAQDLRVDALVATVHPENIYSVNNFLKLGYENLGEKELHGGPRFIFYKRVS